jgi:hypothetical protein
VSEHNETSSSLEEAFEAFFCSSVSFGPCRRGLRRRNGDLVFSPGTVQRDVKKRRIYAAHGVIEYCFVAGRSNTVEVYYFEKDREKPAFVKKENESFTSPCLAGLRISCAKILSGGTSIKDVKSH